MNFKITGPGLYRTRDGRKAEIDEEFTVCGANGYWRGRIDGKVLTWKTSGEWYPGRTTQFDIIAALDKPQPNTQ